MTADRVTRARARYEAAIAEAEREEQLRIARPYGYTRQRLDANTRAVNRLSSANSHNVRVIERFHADAREAFLRERERSRTLAECLLTINDRLRHTEDILEAVMRSLVESGHLDAAHLPGDDDDELSVSPWVAEWRATQDPDEADAILDAHQAPADDDPIARRLWGVAV